MTQTAKMARHLKQACIAECNCTWHRQVINSKQADTDCSSNQMSMTDVIHPFNEP